MSQTGLYWLPEISDWNARLKFKQEGSAARWDELRLLASSKIDFMRTERLAMALSKEFPAPPETATGKPVRLAILSSCTMGHLHASIKVAALRRGIWLDVYENEYGMHLQELMDPASKLHTFQPSVVLVALDSHYLTRTADVAFDDSQADQAFTEIMDELRVCWSTLSEAFRCHVLQQTVLPIHALVLGNNEQRVPGSRSSFVERLNHSLRIEAVCRGIDLVSIDTVASEYGVRVWHDPVLWHRAKQEISPAVAPLYGDIVVRPIAARAGRSAKCLVLDLDNTIWGGVIGDDGLDGIVLGQGSALGEAFLAIQTYAKDLAKRGIILAVCSKNDEAVAFAVFDQHQDMVLRRADIACFIANWNDKATNIKNIAARLNIGLDALVFADDNPFERELVRQSVPMVAVPDLPEDPAFVVQCLVDAGYFEGIAVTDEDRLRSKQYQANLERGALQASTTDLPSYLKGLSMELLWRRIDRAGLARVVQLINKTNQFNLTTRRYTESDVVTLMTDETAFGLQIRLTDRFGDNGMIAVVIGRRQSSICLIDTWLMSCRVLGRQVEDATLNLVADEARRLGASKLVGEYVPTAKNGMVRTHYPKLGFTLLDPPESAVERFELDLAAFEPRPTLMEVKEA